MERKQGGRETGRSEEDFVGLTRLSISVARNPRKYFL
jgi:hypothetical protein